MANATGQPVPAVPEAQAKPAQVMIVLWTVLSLVDSLALVRVESLSEWRANVTDSLVTLRKSIVAKNGKPLTLGGQQTVKGTALRHLPHVSDISTDESGKHPDGQVWQVRNVFHDDAGEVIGKAEFLKLCSDRLSEVNANVRNLA
jgi:hypothetical protein